MSLPPARLLSLAFLLLAPLTQAAVSAEFTVADVAYDLSPNDSQLKLASIGGDVFAVWVRSTSSSGAHILGARVGADGVLLDPNGPVLIDQPSGSLAIAASRDRYLVVAGAAIAIVGRDARVIARRTLPLSGALPRRVASNGREFAIGFESGGVLILDENGETLASPATIAASLEAIVSAGRDFIVVSRRQTPRSGLCADCLSELFAQRITTAGIADEPQTIVSIRNFNILDVAAAGDGESALVAWTENGSCGKRLKARVVVTPSGARGLGGGAVIYGSGATRPPGPSLPLGATSVGTMTMVWAGDSYIITVPTFPVRAIRVARDGSLIDDAQADFGTGALAWNGSELVVPVERELVTGAVAVRFVAPDFNMSRPDVFVGVRVIDETRPRITTNGDSFLVAWSELRGFDVQSRATLLARDGRPIVRDLLVCPGDAKVASDGKDYAVLCRDGSQVIVRGISAGGVLADDGTRVPTGGQYPETLRIAGGPEGYFVVWSFPVGSQSFPPPDFFVHGARLDRARRLLDVAPIEIATETGRRQQMRPSVTWAGNEWTVSWLDRSYPTCPNSNNCLALDALRAANITSGAVTQRFTIRDSSPLPIYDEPAMTSVDGHPVVVWRSTAIHATTIVDGQVLDSVVLIDSGIAPDVAPAGDGIDIVYDNGRHDVLLTHAALGSPTLAADTVPVAASTDPELHPVIAHSSLRTAVAYVRGAAEEPYNGSDRVFVRFIDSLAKRRRVYPERSEGSPVAEQ